MKRLIFSFLSGGLFGAGLLVSGMTNTSKVQGWLDVFGDWDPTLAFVMGGAILPMALAWQLTKGRRPLLGGQFPSAPRPELDHRLITGSVLFGMGWALAGLCPGPAMASLTFNSWGGLVFLITMLIGMSLAPKVGLQLDRMVAKA